jgi:hypothetical protein
MVGSTRVRSERDGGWLVDADAKGERRAGLVLLLLIDDGVSLPMSREGGGGLEAERKGEEEEVDGDDEAQSSAVPPNGLTKSFRGTVEDDESGEEGYCGLGLGKEMLLLWLWRGWTSSQDEIERVVKVGFDGWWVSDWRGFDAEAEKEEKLMGMLVEVADEAEEDVRQASGSLAAQGFASAAASDLDFHPPPPTSCCSDALAPARELAEEEPEDAEDEEVAVPAATREISFAAPERKLVAPEEIW